MLRRIAVIFFILASLVLQVRSVYACELLDGLTTAKCCCSHDILHEDCSLDNRCPASHTSRQDPCCISVITLDTQFITEISGPAEYEKTWTVTAPPLTVIINSTNLELLQGSKQPSDYRLWFTPDLPQASTLSGNQSPENLIHLVPPALKSSWLFFSN